MSFAKALIEQRFRSDLFLAKDTLRHYQKSIPASVKAAATALESELMNKSSNLFRTGSEQAGNQPGAIN
jgi:hypothetical protein